MPESITELFARAIKLLDSDRQQLLNQLSAAQRAELERLIAADDSVQEHGFLQHPIASPEYAATQETTRPTKRQLPTTNPKLSARTKSCRLSVMEAWGRFIWPNKANRANARWR